MNNLLLQKIIKADVKDLKLLITKKLEQLNRKVIIQNDFIFSPAANAEILLVAHTDTVHPKCDIIYSSEDGDLLMSPTGIGGDDRSGVYALLALAHNRNISLLFCDKEETGGIGASAFVNYAKRKSDLVKPLKFIIELDRSGNNDSVFYDCANKDFEKFINSYGFETSIGSFSDISIIAPALKIAAVNLSIGYYSQHSKHEFIVVSDMIHIINRVESIILADSLEKYKYIKSNVKEFRYVFPSSYLDYEPVSKVYHYCENCGYQFNKEELFPYRQLTLCETCLLDFMSIMHD